MLKDPTVAAFQCWGMKSKPSDESPKVLINEPPLACSLHGAYTVNHSFLSFCLACVLHFTGVLHGPYSAEHHGEPGLGERL